VDCDVVCSTDSLRDRADLLDLITDADKTDGRRRTHLVTYNEAGNIIAMILSQRVINSTPYQPQKPFDQLIME
jgi:YD repeat-containing protein